ncbi:MAG TPA: DNA starvation/stationary phase protection protein [Hanamia sp.]|nr:DNA starvation/stationary phase protection protein [Hanamia sp.]
MAKNVKAVKQKPASKDAKQVNQKVVAKNGNQQKENENSDSLNTGLSASNSAGVAEALNQVLADEFVLYTKTLNFHWNIEGRDFHALHLFLDDQYHQLQVIIDSVAERIRKVGHFATGSMQEFLDGSSLQEHNGNASVSEQMLAELASDHDSIIRKTRTLIDEFDQKYDDAGSADFITGIMKEHEKMAWMLRASVPQAK